MINQYFSPRTLPQLLATFPELSGTATCKALRGAAQKLSGGAPRARSPAGLKTGPRPFLAAQNHKKSMRNQYFSPRTLPQLPATFPELSGTATDRALWSRPKAFRRRPGPRARGVQPTSKLVPGENFSKYIIQKKLFRRDKHKQS